MEMELTALVETVGPFERMEAVTLFGLVMVKTVERTEPVQVVVLMEVSEAVETERDCEATETIEIGVVVKFVGPT